MTISNPFKLRKQRVLTDAIREATLAGGKAGHGPGTPEMESAFIADGERGPDLATCLDALLGMHHAYEARDRKELDAMYEVLVTEIEEYRESVPKA